MPAFPRHSRRGLTLVETVVATVLIGLVVVGGLSMLSLSGEIDTRTAMREAALAAASDAMQEARRLNPEEMALSQDAYDAMSTQDKAAWAAQSDDMSALTTAAAPSGGRPVVMNASGALSPRRSTGAFTIDTYVSCAADPSDSSTTSPRPSCLSGATPLERTIRVVARNDRFDIMVPLETRVPRDAQRERLAPGQALAAATGLGTTQSSADAITFSWGAVSRALDYQVTVAVAGEAPIATPLTTSYAWSRTNLTGAEAGIQTEWCVRAVAVDATVGAWTCRALITRPVATAVKQAAGVEVSVTATRPVAIERLRGGTWASVATYPVSSPWSDPDGLCTDRYRAVAYAEGVTPASPALVEGRDLATGAEVAPTGGSC